jgi:hypothetical protein
MKASCCTVVIALSVPGVALGEPSQAKEYARRSTTAFLASELQPLQTVATRLEIDGGVRWHRAGWAVEARAGVGFSASGAANGYQFGFRAGVSAGRSLPVGCRVALTPMVAADVFAYRQGSGASVLAIPRITVELPVSIVLYPHVVLEPVVQVGVQWVDGLGDIAVVLGPRIGVVL